MINSTKAATAPASLKKVTRRHLAKAAATIRNQTVTCGSATPLKLAFRRRPADLTQLDFETPTQLTINKTDEALTAIQIKRLSKHASQGSRPLDIRRHLAHNLRMSFKPFQVGDKVFYWQEEHLDRSDGSKGKVQR